MSGPITLGSQNKRGPKGETGDRGLAGARGSLWFVGKTFPDDAMEFDLFLDEENFDVFQVQNLKWVFIGNIKGADGKKGKDGRDGKDGKNGMIFPGPSVDSGGGGDGELELLEGTISSGQTKVIELIAFTNVIGLKYFVSLYSDDFAFAKNLELNVMRLGSDLKDNVFAKMGNASIELNVVKIDPNAVFAIKNNEAVTLNYRIRKIAI